MCDCARDGVVSLRAIKNSAFGALANNPHPVIISIELHCSDKFQEKIMMTDSDTCLEEALSNRRGYPPATRAPTAVLCGLAPAGNILVH